MKETNANPINFLNEKVLIFPGQKSPEFTQEQFEMAFQKMAHVELTQPCSQP